MFLTLSDLALLALWDEAGLHDTDPLFHVVPAVAALDSEALLDLPIGDRDALFAAVYTARYGPVIEAISSCPRCDAMHEATVHLADTGLLRPVVDTFTDFRHGDQTLQLTAPTTRAVLAAAADPEPMLARWCAAVELPSERWADLMDALDAVDPRVDVRAPLICDQCGHRWEAAFDIACFLRDRLETETESIVDDIHLLASVYGWSEAEILAVPRRRRHLYLARHEAGL